MRKEQEQKRIIDLGNLNSMIEEVEKLFDEYELNMVDRELVVNQLVQRNLARLQKQRAQDIAENISVGGLIGKVMKGLSKSKEDEDEG